jgi:hypothetical protein
MTLAAAVESGLFTDGDDVTADVAEDVTVTCVTCFGAELLNGDSTKHEFRNCSCCGCGGGL